MFFIDTSKNGKPVYNAIVNQSLDNYLVNDLRLKGHGMILYINNPSVIVGVHQNAYAEVNFPYLKQNNIQLVRRTSGGGAVYHDYGNLIFENIVIGDDEHFGDYQYFAQPIIDALHDMGATGVEMRGRNDIVVDGKKFSGMTMFKVGDSYAAGGTLMFDLNMDTASKVLTPEQDKLESKGVKSVNKRITNIKDYLDEPFRSMSADEFKNELLKRIYHVDKLEDIDTYTLTDKDWQIIDDRLKDKYDTDAWNYGENPGFTNYVSKHFDIGTVAFNFSLKDNKISDVKIYGDFITGGDITLVEKALLGAEFNENSLNQALSKVDLKSNLGNIEPQPLVDLLLSQN